MEAVNVTRLLQVHHLPVEDTEEVLAGTHLLVEDREVSRLDLLEDHRLVLIRSTWLISRLLVSPGYMR